MDLFLNILKIILKNLTLLNLRVDYIRVEFFALDESSMSHEFSNLAWDRDTLRWESMGVWSAILSHFSKANDVYPNSYSFTWKVKHKKMRKDKKVK